MAKHVALSARSRRTRTLIGGVMAGGVLALAAPAGFAFADTMGDTVGRPSLGNPAPGVRAAQAIGDATSNNDTPVSSAINGSPLGDAYHKAFGQREVRVNGTIVTQGSNGDIKGVLNARPGIDIPVRECNIKVGSGILIPVGGGRC